MPKRRTAGMPSARSSCASAGSWSTESCVLAGHRRDGVADAGAVDDEQRVDEVLRRQRVSRTRRRSASVRLNRRKRSIVSSTGILSGHAMRASRPLIITASPPESTSSDPAASRRTPSMAPCPAGRAPVPGRAAGAPGVAVGGVPLRTGIDCTWGKLRPASLKAETQNW